MKKISMKKLLFVMLITTTFTHSMKKSRTISNLVTPQTTYDQIKQLPPQIIEKIVLRKIVRYQIPLYGTYKYIYEHSITGYRAFIRGKFEDGPNGYIIIRDELSNEEAKAKFKIIESEYEALQKQKNEKLQYGSL